MRANTEVVRQGIGSDPRIGLHFLYAGVSYGGSCCPKDVKALALSAADAGFPLQLLAAVEAVNEGQKLVLVDKRKEFRTPAFEAIKAALRTPVVFDGRNLYEPAVMAAFGLEYHCIGRPQATPQPCG